MKGNWQALPVTVRQGRKLKLVHAEKEICRRGSPAHILLSLAMAPGYWYFWWHLDTGTFNDTWILVLCSQLIAALSLFNKAEGGALQKCYWFFFLLTNPNVFCFLNPLLNYQHMIHSYFSQPCMWSCTLPGPAEWCTRYRNSLQPQGGAGRQLRRDEKGRN